MRGFPTWDDSEVNIILKGIKHRIVMWRSMVMMFLAQIE